MRAHRLALALLLAIAAAGLDTAQRSTRARHNLLRLSPRERNEADSSAGALGYTISNIDSTKNATQTNAALSQVSARERHDVESSAGALGYSVSNIDSTKNATVKKMGLTQMLPWERGVAYTGGGMADVIYRIDGAEQGTAPRTKAGRLSLSHIVPADAKGGAKGLAEIISNMDAAKNATDKFKLSLARFEEVQNLQVQELEAGAHSLRAHHKHHHKRHHKRHHHRVHLEHHHRQMALTTRKAHLRRHNQKVHLRHHHHEMALTQDQHHHKDQQQQQQHHHHEDQHHHHGPAQAGRLSLSHIVPAVAKGGAQGLVEIISNKDAAQTATEKNLALTHVHKDQQQHHHKVHNGAHNGPNGRQHHHQLSFSHITRTSNKGQHHHHGPTKTGQLSLAEVQHLRVHHKHHEKHQHRQPLQHQHHQQEQQHHHHKDQRHDQKHQQRQHLQHHHHEQEDENTPASLPKKDTTGESRKSKKHASGKSRTQKLEVLFNKLDRHRDGRVDRQDFEKLEKVTVKQWNATCKKLGVDPKVGLNLKQFTDNAPSPKDVEQAYDVIIAHPKGGK